MFFIDGSQILTCSDDRNIKVLDTATQIEVFVKDMGEPIKYASKMNFIT